MKTLAIDIETYSATDLIAAGVYRYAEDPTFQILLLAYAWDDEPVEIIDMTAGGMDMEKETIFMALTDPRVIKTAYNANFERTCLAKSTGLSMPACQWRCTAVQAATLGLPRSLDQVAKALNIEKQKMAAGKALINYFSKPCRETARNGQRTRNFPHHDPERWELFKNYCKQDVEVERAVRDQLAKFPTSDEEQALWCLDQEINDRGVRVDRTLVREAIKADDRVRERLEAEAIKLTGLENPNSVAQLKRWLEEAEDIEIESLNKLTVPQLIKDTESDTVRRVLEIRREMSKTSVKKYTALARAMNSDGRIRGTMMFYGARTGRWAGRIFQPQNLPHNKLPDLDLAREILREGDVECLELLFGDVPDTLSQLIRTALIPAEGRRFMVADFSAIEARVIAWLAGEAWRMEVFKTHGKIYEASASQMFKVPLEKIARGNPEYSLRQKGKIAELALGYGGAKGALEAMGALRMGLTEAELPGLVKAWRNANPAITALWWAVGDAALQAVDRREVTGTHGLTFTYESGFLFLRLPNGRRLAYPRPRIQENRFGKAGLTYEGVDQGRKTWGRIDTYGPKLVENIIQAISRDLLAYSMARLAEAGYRIVLHVHDEVIIEARDGSLEEVCRIMGETPKWAAGLPMRADGYECMFYRKE